jgi:hypothetical protein
MNMAEAYQSLFKTKLRSLIVGAILLFLALVFQFWASSYSTRVASHFVGDIILDNTPVFPLTSIIVEGALLALAGTLVLLFAKPHYLPFTLKAIAILIAVRAFMISATHLGIYPTQIAWEHGPLDALFERIGGQAGYFFSSHTGLPFMMALIFWDRRFLRYFYFALSAVFGAAVLLAHVHYSIDVFAAPFMVYSIFKLTQYLFTEDYALIDPTPKI